MNSDRLWF
jgi:hypothetical protein